ncbi:U3 small nucleolar ribonucleoprotein protein [Cavenderia fasciculata]|uniref:U3 small nucleolar ribonucleoprotein protein n=1 Tax=Cavenderia fasciculata TaxID=261658 RepID=F4Q5P5_CACFS|nr:U3 small nucleolar ribonucleoprotein [Cavenderia fasciculata]EGG17304.1 U3 small nucleolar ribonucleoprotein protein [Cavenderia fasciculata]|eukprot:XP_004355788.1 U3 small nucleolar ribonucleoprotein protein [Cavenderia fasciculata]
MRQLKHTEQKLLKKVNLVHYKKESPRDLLNMQTFGIASREEYQHYVKLVNSIQKLVNLVGKLPEGDPVKKQVTDQLVEKLYDMGVVDEKVTASLAKVGVSHFCRRRILSMLVQHKFAQNLTHSMTLIKHCHVRIGPEVVTDPAFLVTRKFQDLMTWTDQSSMKKKVMEYNNNLDDYDYHN